MQRMSLIVQWRDLGNVEKIVNNILYVASKSWESIVLFLTDQQKATIMIVIIMKTTIIARMIKMK